MYMDLTAAVAAAQTGDHHHRARLSRHRRAAREAAAAVAETAARDKAEPAYRSDRVALSHHMNSGCESRPARA